MVGDTHLCGGGVRDGTSCTLGTSQGTGRGCARELIPGPTEMFAREAEKARESPAAPLTPGLHKQPPVPQRLAAVNRFMSFLSVQSIRPLYDLELYLWQELRDHKSANVTIKETVMGVGAGSWGSHPFRIR